MRLQATLLRTCEYRRVASDLRHGRGWDAGPFTTQGVSLAAISTTGERSHELLTMPSLALLCVIRREFREMPGMRFTQEQFRRLWKVTTYECERNIDCVV
jgi:hypothetical protein